MALNEGYSTARPPLFNGENFSYWKKRMEVYLKTDMEQWFSIKRGYIAPTEESGEILDLEKWNPEMKKKAQNDFKAMNTLQCGMTMEELNRVGPYENSKELWDKLIELHEGTKDSKVTKRDLLLNSLFNIKMQEGETASQLHARIKGILNGLHLIGHQVDNRDVIRYALNAFTRNSLWASMIDAYKVSRNLSKVKLDELFCELELHEQMNAIPAEKGVALIAGTPKETKGKNKVQPESEDESNSDSDEEEQLVNMVRKIFTRKKRTFTKRDLQRMANASPTNTKTNVTCYGCQKKGHFKSECPSLTENKFKSTRRKKALKATWDESSSEESEDEEVRQMSHRALMATRSDSEAESEYELSHGSTSESENNQEVTFNLSAKFFKIIACLNKKLVKAEEHAKLLLEENNNLKKQLDLTSSTHEIQSELSNQVAKLEDEKLTLNNQVEDLKGQLEKFTSGTKYLDMILGTQRAVYNRSGIGYNSNASIKSYLTLLNQKKRQVKAWVPKKYLNKQNGQKQFYIPKDEIYYLNPKHKSYNVGGGSKLVRTSKT